tara:strand:- start:1719 stop:2087 length:369 start_codon:yes stop_codon:yes gene_type:complete
MKNWKKENRTKMKVWYSLDKYREAESYLDTIEIAEGFQSYLNTPMAQSYINLETDNGHVSISRDLVLKVEFETLPKWTILKEAQVVDAAKMRLKTLENDIEIQKNTFDQEERLKDTIGDGVQ